MLSTFDKLVLTWVGALIGGSFLYLGAQPLGLDRVPASFWGVVVGSLFTIVGVTLSNVASDKRQASQFEHEQRLKALERQHTIRRDVYMEAAVAFSAGITTAAKMMNLNLSEKEVFEDWQAKAPAISKATLVATMPTFKIMQEFQADVSSTVMRLSIRRGEAAGYKIALAKIQAEGPPQDGSPDSRPKAIAYLEGEIKTKSARLMRECLDEVSRLILSQGPLLAATRVELDVPTDADAIDEILAATNVKMRTMVRELVDIVDPQGSGKTP